MKRWERCAGTLAFLIGATTTAYACCYYKMQWQNGESSCEGTVTQYCEDSSPNCNPPSSGSDYSCMITASPPRYARCYKITLGQGGSFLKGDCNFHPGTGWHIVGRLPDGSCCWMKGYQTWEVEQTLTYQVNICSSVCIAAP